MVASRAPWPATRRPTCACGLPEGVKEPVAGLEVRGRMEWFGRLDGAKALASFVKLVDRDGDAALPGRLEKRRSVSGQAARRADVRRR